MALEEERVDIGSSGLVPSFQFLSLALDFRDGECANMNIVKLNSYILRLFLSGPFPNPRLFKMFYFIGWPQL